MPNEMEADLADLRTALTELLAAWDKRPKDVFFPPHVGLWLRRDMKPALYKARALVETIN